MSYLRKCVRDTCGSMSISYVTHSPMSPTVDTSRSGVRTQSLSHSPQPDRRGEKGVWRCELFLPYNNTRIRASACRAVNKIVCSFMNCTCAMPMPFALQHVHIYCVIQVNILNTQRTGHAWWNLYSRDSLERDGGA